MPPSTSRAAKLSGSNALRTCLSNSFMTIPATKASPGAVRSVDWANVLWEEALLSGAELRRVAVPRTYQHAVDEARWRTLKGGVQDERPHIIGHWRTAGPGALARSCGW